MTHLLTDVQLDEVSLVEQGADQDAHVVLVKRSFTQDQRDAMAASGEAMPDGSFPIANKADLKNAIQASGRAEDKAAAKAHIIRRARALDAVDSLPEDWNVSKGVPMADLHDDVKKALEGVEGAEALTPELVEALNAFATARAEAAPVAEPVAEGEPTEPVAKTEPELTEPTEPVAKSEPQDITKSAEFVDLAKRLEATEAELAKARTEAEVADLAKRLNTEASALGLHAEDTARLLVRVGKNAATAEDREAVIKLLSAASAAVAEAGTFVETGSSTDADDTDSEFTRLVQKTMTDNPGMSKPTAVAKTLETAEGRKAYQASR